MTGDRRRTRSSTFGPSALATPANAVTVARLLAAPLIVVMVAVWGPSWGAFAVVFAVGATDGLDGWLARRQGTTTSGAFLDPLADKACVIGALMVVAARGEVGWLPVVLITAREVGMQLYRTVLSRRGVSVPARPSAKVKTLVQGIAVLMCLAPPVASHHLALTVAVWVAAALTILTGLQYLEDGRRMAGATTPTAAGRPGDPGAGASATAGEEESPAPGAARAGTRPAAPGAAAAAGPDTPAGGVAP